SAWDFHRLSAARKADCATKFPLFLRAGGFQEGKNEYRVPVAIEVPYASIRFEANKGTHSARLLVLGIVRDPAGNLVRRFGRPVKMSLTDEQYKTVRAGTVSLRNQVRVPIGDYSVEVVVKDELASNTANGRQNLYLGQMENSFGLSSMLLASDRELYKTADKDDQFLTVQGVKILPSAACQFRNGDNM